MTTLTSDFRHRLWPWLAPLLFVIVNVVLYSTYQAAYAGRVDLLHDQSESEEETLNALREQRRALETVVERAQRGKDGIEALYQERFSTERKRLTQVIREVKDLAGRAGLGVPESISYPEEAIERHDLVKRQIVFVVEGNYMSLRQFINMLELSESFIVLEQISVTEAGPSTLRVSLQISTLFASEDGPERRRA